MPSDDFFRNRTVYSQDLSNYKRVSRNWFAYATNHLAEGSIGLQDRFSSACVSPIYTVFSCGEGVDPSYLYRVLKSPDLLLHYKLHEQASVDRRGAVRYRDFAKIPLILPPLAEQQRIAGLLDKADKPIRSTERLIAKLELAKQGLLYDLLTNSVDAAGHVRNRDSQRSEFKDSPIGRIPSGWQVMPLEKLVVSSVLGTTIRGARGLNDIPLIKMGNLGWGFLGLQQLEYVDRHLLDFELPSLRLAPGDLLFNTRNTPELVGKTAVWDEPFEAVTDNNILRLRFDRSVRPRFLCSYMSSGEGRRRLRRLATGTTSVAAIYWHDLKSYLAPVPPISEQIVFEEMLDAIESRMRYENMTLLKLRASQAGLMDDLLKGQVQVGALA
jgi:type I restriction enzyme S subunit